MSQHLPLVDVHAHLTDERLAADVPGVIDRAAAAGIVAIVNNGTDLADSGRCVELARREPLLWAAVGVHPHEARTWTADTLPLLETLLQEEKVVALGEFGLDFHYDFSPRDQQKAVFATQWEFAAKAGVTAVIHVREAYEEFFGLIAGLPRPPRVLLHCFSGDLEIARRALDLGFEFSVGGPLTYPKSTATRAVFQFLPLDRIHLETDCPYLAPQPKRGKDNEPAFLPMTFTVLCQVKALPPEKIAGQLLANARLLFPKMRI